MSNTMNKFYSIVIVVGIWASCAHAAIKDMGQAMQYLVSIHNKTFGVDNLFAQQLNFKEWYSLCDELETFIVQNGKGKIVGSISGFQHAAIASCLKKVTRINVDFINILQSLWTMYFSKKTYSQAFYEAAQRINKLEEIRKSLIALQKDPGLVKVSQDKSDSYRYAAAQVLISWTQFIEVTLDKAIKDAKNLNEQFARKAAGR